MLICIDHTEALDTMRESLRHQMAVKLGISVDDTKLDDICRNVMHGVISVDTEITDYERERVVIDRARKWHVDPSYANEISLHASVGDLEEVQAPQAGTAVAR